MVINLASLLYRATDSACRAHVTMVPLYSPLFSLLGELRSSVTSLLTIAIFDSQLIQIFLAVA